MSVQAEPSAEVWILKALPYADSQLSATELMVSVAPRSTLSHCGSLAALDQRVPVLPSTAAEAGVPAFSVLDAVAVLPWAALVAVSHGPEDGLPPGNEPNTWNSYSE